MPVPGDLCLLQDLKLYMGGANPADTGNDNVLASLITAASAFIAAYLDRDLMSLGGQGMSAIASIGTDAGGAFVTLSAALPAIPPPATQMTDLASAATTAVIAPAGAIANSTGKVYLAATTSLSAGDPVSFAFLRPYAETYDGGGKPWQWIKQWPIGSLTSVIDLPSGQAYALSAIAADPELPRLLFKTSLGGSSAALMLPSGAMLGQVFSPGIQNLQITYTAGYLTPPADLAQAARELALLWFKNRDRLGVSGQGMLGTHVSFFNTSDLLPETRLKLNPYRRTMRGF